jgi:nucleotide sugar dehydrogenase
MPGNNYLSSITDFWRVYSGHTDEAADLCEDFLGKVINVQVYPLCRLKSTIDSETAKVLENTYRAINIAFIAEWGRYAEKRGVDLFEIIKAIRLRPTHNNIMQPGFGVGGYCLPKDPAFISVSSRELFKDNDIHFPMTELAVQINREMPKASISMAKEMLDGAFKGKRVLLLGISYRSDVSDTRNSPSQVFFEKVNDQGAEVMCYDPLVEYWDEMGIETPRQIPASSGFDLVVFAVQHEEFKNLNIGSWLDGNTLAVLDANNVLSPHQRSEFESKGCPVAIIGIGRPNE